MTTTLSQAQRYLADRHLFRQQELVLPNGQSYGAVEEAWQRDDIFAPLDARTPSGQWEYRLLYLELARGHAKSTMGAMEAITTAIMEPDFRIYLAAADQDQASILMDLLRGMVQRNPRLSRAFRVGKTEASVPATGSAIKVLSSDAATAYGLGGTGKGYLAIVDELWAHKSRDLWDSLWSATGKVPTWRVIVLSNAGYDTQSVAWEVRELCRTLGPPFYLYSPDGPVASWLTDEWRELQGRTLPSDVYQRLIENKWVEGSGSFITRAQLNVCIDPTWTSQLTGASGVGYVTGVDLGLVKDRTALAVGHLDRGTQEVVLDYLRVWQGTRTDPGVIGDVEEELLGLRQRFDLLSVALDVWQMQGSIQRLRDRLPIQGFTFTSESVRRLSETLFSLIQSGRLRLFPDQDLERELLAMNVVQRNYGWRIDHRSGGFSDRVMALGMMAMEALTPRSEGIGIWL